MPIFGHGKSTDWHQQIDSTANGQHPSTPEGELNPFFPWDQLQQHTNSYLKKKGKLSTHERDRKLAGLIREHDAKDIAMAACALLMSPIYVRDMVRQELNIHPGRGQDLHSFLQTVVAASHQSPEAIDMQEAQRAQWLIPFCSRSLPVAGPSFRALMILLKDLIPPRSILYVHTEALAQQACLSFVTQLEEMRMANLWIQLHETTEWLSTLAGVSLDLSAQSLSLLEKIFPTWPAWASWRPSISRLQLWSRLDINQQKKLKDILALEGPDLTNSGKSTLWEGLISTRHTRGSRYAIVNGNINIELRNGELRTAYHIINLLLRTVDDACKAGADELALLVHFSIGTTLDAEGLRILGMVSALGDTAVTAAMLRVHNARTADRKEQLAAITQFLPTLDNPRGEELRNTLAPYLLDSLSHCVEEMQEDLGRILEAGDTWDGTEIRLQAFGQGIKDTAWVRPLLHTCTKELLDCWPTKKTIDTLRELRLAASILSNEKENKDNGSSVDTESEKLKSRFAKLRLSVKSTESSGTNHEEIEESKIQEPLSLVKLIDQYCVDALISQAGAIEVEEKAVVEVFLAFWQAAVDENRRAIALIVSGRLIGDFEYVRRILTKLPELPNDFVVKLRAQLQQYAGGVHGDIACVSLARMLASTHLYDAIASWRPTLDQMMRRRGHKLIDYILNTLDAKSWCEWLSDLRQIYGTYSPLIVQSETSPPSLWPRLMLWGKRLETYLPTITTFQTNVESADWLKCIQMGSDDQIQEDTLTAILAALTFQTEAKFTPIFKKAISSLKEDGENAEQISNVISLITSTTSFGFDACRRVLDMSEQASKEVAVAFLGLYKNSNDMTPSDVSALDALAKLLFMDIDPHGNVDDTSLDAATDYLVDRFNTIFEEAQRLEDLRVAFKAADPDGTSAMLESLGIEDSTAAQDALSSLPASLIDLVEMVGDQEVEMQIPLALTALQRVSLGVENANSIILRLNLPESNLPLAFCLHLDNEPKTNTGAHRPWMVSDGNRAPAVPVCFGRPSRALYQLSRTLFRHLQEGYNSLADVHKLLSTSLKDISHHCIVCGVHLGAQLRRSTLCRGPECHKIFARSRIAIRLSDINDDTAAVDALLTLVYAAAASNKAELLPGCPIKDPQTVKQILNLLPAVSQLRNVSDLSVVFKSRHPQSEELLSWALNGHRGFFTSASGHLRIPGMAGAHQFVLASAAPELEAAFAAQVVLNGGKTRVVFHATSLDRVFSILTQGLRVHSGTSLQRTGAYYGNGVYVAETPTTAAGFFAPHMAASIWSAATMKNVRVLLGCELAGTGTVPPNTTIHVVSNPDQLIVRHVFLMPPTAVVPTLATHVTPAMGSVFSFLRSSAP